MREPYLQFLGVGGSSGMELGSAAAVLADAAGPRLLIDCGQDVPQRYAATFGGLPPAVFLTHLHMDHVAGLEPLFYAAWFDPGRQAPVRLYVPAPIVPALQQRLVSERSPLAEGGVNFWDAFQLVPVERGFWHAGAWFDVFQVRHHRPGFAYGLRLAGAFVYTGDTRPIPEVLQEFAAAGERVFHDCRPDGNPSHAGWADLAREYPPQLLDRVHCYHFGTRQDGVRLRMLGARVVEVGRRYPVAPAAAADVGRPDTPPDDSSFRVA